MSKQNSSIIKWGIVNILFQMRECIISIFNLIKTIDMTPQTTALWGL